MKNSLLRALPVLGFCAAICPLNLLAQNSIRFTVPFDFTAGGKTFAAGPYYVEFPRPLILAIFSADNRQSEMLIAHGGEASRSADSASLTFNKYGDRYFLERVSGPYRGWELPRSPAEKELNAKAEPHTPVTLAAARPK